MGREQAAFGLRSRRPQPSHSKTRTQRKAREREGEEHPGGVPVREEAGDGVVTRRVQLLDLVDGVVRETRKQ